MISLLITNYNTWDLVTRCILAVDQCDSENVIKEIIIVDDCSAQPVPEIIKNHKNLKIIFNKENLGYATSVNIAFNNASNNICLLLDSDAYPIENLSFIVEKFREEPNLGILGLNLVDENGCQTGRAEPEPTFWSVLLGQQLESKIIKYNKSQHYTLYSCGIAVNKLAFDAVGGFDQNFDFLEADNDFSMKINRSKWYLSIDERVVVFHKGGGSPQLTSKRVIRFYKNRIKLLKKYDRYRAEKMFNMIITLRLFIEYALINIGGRFKYSDEVFADKLFCRKELIKLFLVGHFK